MSFQLGLLSQARLATLPVGDITILIEIFTAGTTTAGHDEPADD